MPRKSVTDLKTDDKIIEDALADFMAVSEVKGEIASDEYKAQDAKTRKVIDGMVATLANYALGTVKLAGVDGIVIYEEAVRDNLLYLAMELAKDLALVGIRVGNFQFPTNLCAICGGDV